MQIVLKNNRVMAHGGTYIMLGNTVIDTASQKIYTEATIAECNNCPADIDTVGYEYHAGEFVPCAPFGKGSGNVAVVCGEDCKSIKDSGISFADIYNKINTTIVKGTYAGLYGITHNASSNSTETANTTITTPSRIKGMLIFGSETGHFAAISASGRVIEYKPKTFKIDDESFERVNHYTGATASVTDNSVTITVYKKYRFDSQVSYLSYHDYTYDYVLFL